MWDGTKMTNDYLVLIAQFVRLDNFTIILILCYEYLWSSSVCVFVADHVHGSCDR